MIETRVLQDKVPNHSSLLICFNNNIKMRKRPFRFFNFYIEHPDAHDIVQRAWEGEVTGCATLNFVLG